MPPRFGGGAKCPRCQKTVYAAEETKALGKSFHKLCFKCTTCNKLLDSTNCTDRGDDVFCKTCYAKQFGPQGYGYGQGAGTLVTYTQKLTISDDEKKESGSSEPVSETVEETGNVAETPAPSATETSVEQQSDVVENGASKAQDNAAARTPSPVDVSAARSAFETKSTVPSGNSDVCPRCKKIVYFAERLQGGGKTWHKLCYRCQECGKQLDSFATEKDGDVYCKSCYAKKFGPKGYGYGGTLQHTA